MKSHTTSFFTAYTIFLVNLIEPEPRLTYIFILEEITSFYGVTAISVLDGTAVMMIAQRVRDQGSIPIEAQNVLGFFHLFEPLLHLVVNVISELKKT